MPELVFAIPGDIETLTGGYAYDRRVIVELRTRGWDVTVLALGDDFPAPSPETAAQALHLLADVPATMPLLIDGLALGVLPGVTRLPRKLIALVHHPLALESGIAPNVAARLAACERTALTAASRVIVTSQPTADILAADYSVPAEIIAVARPGTDPLPRATGSGGPEVSLLSVGSVVARKGHDLLATALSRLTHLPWRLTIVGDDTRDAAALAALNAAIAQGGIADRITLAGAIPADAIARYYAAADAFVLASHFEGYGMAYAEALASSLPILGTTGGAVASVLPAGAALLVPPGDVGALTTALARLIGDAAYRQSLSQAAWEVRDTLPSWRQAADVIARTIGAAA